MSLRSSLQNDTRVASIKQGVERFSQFAKTLAQALQAKKSTKVTLQEDDAEVLIQLGVASDQGGK